MKHKTKTQVKSLRFKKNNFPAKEFKALVIRILTELEKIDINEFLVNIITIKKNHSELKNNWSEKMH